MLMEMFYMVSVSIGKEFIYLAAKLLDCTTNR
jgi:hypothetical protein